jgi:F0F1-type ATP synthase assembly protein I
MSFTLQVTAVFVVPVTVAVNCCEAPVDSVAEAGKIVTMIVAVIVTVADADLEGSATLVALTVTWLGLGTMVAAV